MKQRTWTLWSALVTGMVMVACGGGGSGSSSNPATTPVTFTVLGGVNIVGAKVCVDANLDGDCTLNEVSGITGSNGKVTLQVPSSILGQYPALAYVGQRATDADTANSNDTRYVLAAPASYELTQVISPLSTVVQQLIYSGMTPNDASKQVQTKTALSQALPNYNYVNPLNDNKARVIARAMIYLMKSAWNSLDGADRTGLNKLLQAKGANGQFLTYADLDSVIRAGIVQNMSDTLNAIKGLYEASDCNAPGSVTCESAIESALANYQPPGAASAGVNVNVTAANVTNAVNASRTPAQEVPGYGTPLPPAQVINGVVQPQPPEMSLTWLYFTGHNSWNYRAWVSSPTNADEISGLYHRNLSVTDSAGTVTQIGGYSLANGLSNNLYWDCDKKDWLVVGSVSRKFHTSPPIVDPSTGKLTAVHETINCDGQVKELLTVKEVDYAGQSIWQLVNDIRTWPLPTWLGYNGFGTTNGSPATVNNTVGALSVNQNKDNAKLLSAGAKLRHVTTTRVQSPFQYNPTNPSQVVRIYSPELSAGDPTACANSANAHTQVLTTGLDTLINQAKGTPCIYKTASGTDGYWWDASALYLYDGIRVTFPDGMLSPNIIYYTCWIDCKKIGTGTYTITVMTEKTSGNTSRVLSFNNQPAELSAYNFNQIFVERLINGTLTVYQGVQEKPTQFSDVRLNYQATKDLFDALNVTDNWVPN